MLRRNTFNYKLCTRRSVYLTAFNRLSLALISEPCSPDSVKTRKEQP